jgi:lysophospholipase L1-like esterase
MRLLADYLASLNAANTVNFRQWNFTTGAAQTDGYNLGGWDALGAGKSEVVQVGTGGGVVDIYNMAATGTQPSYVTASSSRWAVVNAPFSTTAPDLLIINHGHNTGSGTETAQSNALTPLIRLLRSMAPRAGMLLTAQNPTNPARGGYDAEDINRAYRTVTIAAYEQCGLIDALGAFLSHVGWETDYLNADGLHENQAGATAWFEKAIKPHFQPVTAFGRPATPAARTDHIFIPASQMYLFSGTPSLAVVNSNMQMWTLKKAEIGSIQADVSLPEHWPAYDVFVEWATPAASGYTASSRVAFRLLRQQQIGGVVEPALTTNFAPGSLLNSGIQLATPNNSSAYYTFSFKIGNGTANPKGPLSIRIQRDGTDASDTVSEDILVKGIVLKRTN